MPWTCTNCQIVREKPEKRAPSGWKKRGKDLLCDACWAKLYLQRTVTAPVMGVVDLEWKQLDDALKVMWQMTTQAANWIMTEMYVRDVKREQGMEKLPAMPKIYLYPEIRQRWPALPSTTAASLEHTLAAKYRAVRRQILWTGQMSLPNYKYPTPFPVPAQRWSLHIADEGELKDVPVLNTTIGDHRIYLKLPHGNPWRRQYTAFQRLSSGDALGGEMALYRDGKYIMAKLVAWLPRSSSGAPKSGLLRVRTSALSLMVAVNDKDETLWTYNADHLKRWIAEHRWMLQRLSEDAKYEQRPVPKFALKRKEWVRNFANRMDTACHEIAAQLAGYAERRRFAQVVYDDTERGFVPSFPYLRLATLIQEKLDERGIEFALARTEVMPESGEAALGAP